MPPKVKVDVEDAPPPRRSTRVIPSATTPAVKPPAKAPAKKKSVDDDPEFKPGARPKAAKKAKAEAPAEEEEEEEEEETGLATIDIGDSLPEGLTLKNEKDEDVDVLGLTEDHGLVLFLVPKADTPGCTTQACGFRDSHPDFTTTGYAVYCLSADTSAAQTKWQTKKELPYSMLSDRKRVLITALGAGDGGKTKRSHFVFEKGGKLLDKKMPVKPADSPKLALEFIKSLSE